MGENERGRSVRVFNYKINAPTIYLLLITIAGKQYGKKVKKKDKKGSKNDAKNNNSAVVYYRLRYKTFY